MSKALIVSFGQESLIYAHHAKQSGLHVNILDCFDEYHMQLKQWFGSELLHVPGRRAQVKAAVEHAQIDVAIVQESDDHVRTALLVQTLRDSHVPLVIVVCPQADNRVMYRRCGAHHTVVAPTPDEAWTQISAFLSTLATA